MDLLQYAVRYQYGEDAIERFIAPDGSPSREATDELQDLYREICRACDMAFGKQPNTN